MKVLHHPNIIQFKEEFVTHEYLYYVIEYIDGMDLFQYVNQNDYLTEEIAGYIMSEILNAIKYLNKVGIVHRDLKPENIMIKLDKVDSLQPVTDVKLIDFGFAMYLKEAACSQCCGTINYVAPEIFLGRPYNAKTDIFSLGVILFFMIRGELPFSHQIKEVVVRNIVKGNYEMDSDEFFLGVSEDCKDLIRKMLQLKVADRIDVDGCMEHPWIVSHRGKTKTVTMQSVGGPLSLHDSGMNLPHMNSMEKKRTEEDAFRGFGLFKGSKLGI